MIERLSKSQINIMWCSVFGKYAQCRLFCNLRFCFNNFLICELCLSERRLQASFLLISAMIDDLISCVYSWSVRVARPDYSGQSFCLCHINLLFWIVQKMRILLFSKMFLFKYTHTVWQYHSHLFLNVKPFTRQNESNDSLIKTKTSFNKFYDYDTKSNLKKENNVHFKPWEYDILIFIALFYFCFVLLQCHMQSFSSIPLENECLVCLMGEVALAESVSVFEMKDWREPVFQHFGWALAEKTKK